MNGKQRVTVTEDGTTNYNGWKLVFPGATVTESGGVVTVTVSGGGGSSDHATLSHLAWLSSAHTLSGAYKLAGSAGSTAAAEISYTAFAATLLDDPDAATARATLGAAYVSRAISTTLPLAGGGDLSADRTLTLSGWSGTTDGKPLYRNGTAVGTATLTAPLTFSGGVFDVSDFVGDSGSGGTRGTVPAPAAGDGAAQKYLCANGTWNQMPTGMVTFYPDPTVASSIATYFVALTTPSTVAESTLTNAATGTSDTLMAAFATVAGVPGVTTIPHGTYSFHFHVETGASNQIGRVKVEVYSCSSTGTSETLRSSGYSDSFSGTSQELNIDVSDASGYTISATDRLVFKVYTARVSGPTTCDITVYFNGVTRNPHFLTTIGEVSPSVIGAEPAITAGTTSQYWRGDKSWQTLDKAAIGLGSVENTALSTWAGTTNITTLGTIATGVWHGTAIGEVYGGTAQTTYTAGDMLYASASNTLSKLSIGSATYLLSVVGGVPAWRSPANIRTDLGLVIGTNVQAWDTDLDALAALSSTGILVRTGAGTADTRTITGGTGISVTNGSGVGGNPTISLTGGSNVDRDETLAHTVMVYPATAIGADNMVITVVGSALAYDSTSNVAYSTVSASPGSWSASNWDMLYFGQPSVAYWLCGMQGTLTNATHKIGYRTTGGNTANLIDNTIQALFVYRQASGANWRFITQATVGGASTDTDTTVAVAASTLYRFRMTVASGGGSVEIGIRTWNTGTLQWGAEVTKTVTTNLPPASTKMGPQQACFNQGGTFYGASFYVTKPFSAGL